MITFVILTKNHPHFLEKCLNHLKDQTINDWDAVVIDTSSPENEILNKNIITPFGAQVEHWPYVFESGFAAKNNMGIEQALKNDKCKFICLLNDDAFIEPVFIEKILYYANDYPDVYAFSPLFMYANSPGKIQVMGGGFFYEYSLCGEYQLCKDTKLENISPDVLNIPQYLDCGYGAAIVYRREAFEQLGLLDINFRHGFDEPDFAKRMALKKMDILYVPALVQHVCGGSSENKKWWQNLHAILPMTYGRLYFLLKHYPIEVVVGDELRRIGGMLFKPKQVLLELYSLAWNSFHAQDARADYHELYDPPEPTKAELLDAREKKIKIKVVRPPFKFRLLETFVKFSFAIGLLIVCGIIILLGFYYGWS